MLIVGVGIIAVGGYHIWGKGLSKRFAKDLVFSGGQAVTAPRVAGYTAKGSVLGAPACALLIVATLTADPSKGAGLDAAVKTLGHAPFGRVLLIIAAAGLAAYGAYCFVLARFAMYVARMSG